jgi:hypothetical protein
MEMEKTEKEKFVTTRLGPLRRWQQSGYAAPNTAPQQTVYRIWRQSQYVDD